MSVDLTQLAMALLSLVSVAVTTAIPIVVPALLKRLHVANDADLTAKLDTALNAGAGNAYKFAAGLINQGGLNNVDVHNAALAMGANYVASNVPGLLTELGITTDKVHAMVSARLGTLLAADPSVSAGQPTTPTAVAVAKPVLPVPGNPPNPA